MCFVLMQRRTPRSTKGRSSAASMCIRDRSPVLNQYRETLTKLRSLILTYFPAAGLPLPQGIPRYCLPCQYRSTRSTCEPALSGQQNPQDADGRHGRNTRPKWCHHCANIAHLEVSTGCRGRIGRNPWPLYTSDAADEHPCVDLGGRRTNSKKQTTTNTRNATIHHPQR